MYSKEYWIWLQSALMYASSKPIRVLEHFVSAKEFYDAGYEAWKNLKLFTPKELTALKKTELEASDKIIEACKRKNYQILTPEDPFYPKRLLRITTPPAVLYVKGSIEDIDDHVVVTMVGTRNSTDHGNKIAAILSYRLAESGAIVLSGGARGIDTHCHLGALEAKGKTIVALGCGLDFPYLPENFEMRCRAAENGAIITEYQPDFGATKYTFPQRNRIMAALSLATVVVEASKKSGALITADLALEYGKDVFVVPGSVMDKEYSGNNKLLRDGAKTVFSAMDILSEYLCEYPHRLNVLSSGTAIGEDIVLEDVVKIETHQQKKKTNKSPKTIHNIKLSETEFVPLTAPDMVTASAKKIYESFTNWQMPFDILVASSCLPAREALRAVTELELFGLIEAKPGNSYAIPQVKGKR